MLRCLVKITSDWELVLSKAEFAYNNSVNRSIGLSPFRICTGYDAPTTHDLTPSPPMFPASTSAIEFSNHTKEVHDEIRMHLESTYASVKAKIDPHRSSK